MGIRDASAAFIRGRSGVKAVEVFKASIDAIVSLPQITMGD